MKRSLLLAGLVLAAGVLAGGALAGSPRKAQASGLGLVEAKGAAFPVRSDVLVLPAARKLTLGTSR